MLNKSVNLKNDGNGSKASEKKPANSANHGTSNNSVKFPGIATVIHGNGAVAHVMGHVCGGVIGYPITPSTEISEIYEFYRAGGGINVWGKHPFFFEPEGEHSAQSGALGASLTGGQYISNASSSQGILYGLESHYVTAGKKVGGFVLHVAARVVSKHSLNVMAGHDDVYALATSGYTIMFGSNPQEAADLAAIGYRVSSLSLIPVANAMDGFATSHMQSEALLPEPELLKQYLGDPESRIKAPTLAQEMLFGAKGRVAQLQQFLQRHKVDITSNDMASLETYLEKNAPNIETDNTANDIAQTLGWIPETLQGQWQRQWRNAYQKGTRQLVPAIVDLNNPGLTGPVQNQPDFQAGAADHRTHFANEVPGFVSQAMRDYSALTGRFYGPIKTFMIDDADYIMLGMGSVTDDIEAVITHLRTQGRKVGLVAIKLFYPFPEADVVAALAGKKAVTVLERTDATTLTGCVISALFKAQQNNTQMRHQGIPAITDVPTICTGIFGLGGHDLQPRHLIAAFNNMESEAKVPLFYLGSQFFAEDLSPAMTALQDQLKITYPETAQMAVTTTDNPHLLPANAFRVRFHSVGGYGTIATGKLLTDVLSGVLGLHSKSAPKYGSEKSGSPTNFYLTLSSEPIKITNAELEDVEIVISPDHKVFDHTNPLRGLTDNGSFIMQSNETPEQVWDHLPVWAQQTIRAKHIQLYVVDAFGIAKENAPTEDLQIRMMGIAFIGALCGHVDRVIGSTSQEAILAKILEQINKKFGAKGEKVVAGNMAVIQQGFKTTKKIDYKNYKNHLTNVKPGASVAISASMVKRAASKGNNGLFDKTYFDTTTFDHFKTGTIGESPIFPGSGLFIPNATAAWKDKGLFRLRVPEYIAHLCTACMECALACPDAAIPNTVHEIHVLLTTAINNLDVAQSQKDILSSHVISLSNIVREIYRQLPSKDPKPFHEIVTDAVVELKLSNATAKQNFANVAAILANFPVAKTRPFFDAMEKSTAGTGALYSVVIDPWKCTGCIECIDVCGPGALIEKPQTAERSKTLAGTMQFLSTLPNTPQRFFDTALADGDIKRLIIDHNNYYAVTGGHGACRGCGEMTAIRLLSGTNRAIHHKRYLDRVAELENLIAKLTTKIKTLGPADSERQQHLQRLLVTLESRLYFYESGPSGDGPANAVIANATGCSSVFASTMPFNPYTDPWVNSLFQDSAPLAKGIFEGLASSATDEYKAVRIAELELKDEYDSAVHDRFFKFFDWNYFSEKEHGLLPAVISMGGDGATYDIGFGALSRVLSSNTPLKAIVLNTGTYSNTGGQTSTSAYAGQDSDLSRIGAAHAGKSENRKELSLIAAFHPSVLVVQTSVGLQNHYLKNIVNILNYSASPAFMDIYTPCQPEHGISDDSSANKAKLAVDSRLSPVFVHDPRCGATLAERFDLDGNPDVNQDWTTSTMQYIDTDGNPQLQTITLTPADFALTEGRFKKQFKVVKDDKNTVPVNEFINLSPDERVAMVPFVWSTDRKKHLIKMIVSPEIVKLTENRLNNWHTLQYLSGLTTTQLETNYQQQLQEWQEKYHQSAQQREDSIDSIARGMSQLAAGSRAPSMAAGNLAPTSVMVALPTATKTDKSSAGVNLPLVDITEQDIPKCTNCKTCYQDLGELFECFTIMDGGTAKEVSRVIPGILDKIDLTEALISKAERIADECDAEIIQFNRPA